MKPYITPEALRYLKKNRKHYFFDDAGNTVRKRHGICYRTFCRALQSQPVEIRTAYSVLEILEVPKEKQTDLIDWI